ncbi:phenylacetate--CoA ligase family protein [Radiobacillus deserti]|uniref:Phenylacetate--CoA ligase family protein n=1 Tax=Radiobacillus deserti TaxID=2594883 RepID=A0A516KJ78_9BACI|nr:phenylacetate--CoA ligase family protein [Radiobacillus deserti]QDP41454.1 phenylacetate--CoA ligase family protein [Radiobacillus deserti]
MDIAKKIYKNSPNIIKLPIEYVYGSIPNKYKYGAKYREMKRLLEKSQWWPKEKHIEYQTMEMKKLLIHSYEHVKYYKDVFDDYGFNPYTFKNLEDIQILPLLNKSIINDNFQDLQSDNYPSRKKMLTTTGGTSGNQLKFFAEKNYNQVEWPFVELIWERVGYTSKSRVAALRNDSFRNRELFKYDWKERRLIIDNFHLSDSNIKTILDKLNNEKVEYIHTYPSAILSLCEYIKRTGFKMENTPKAILATSENIYPGQKEIVEGIFNSRLFTFYGHSERACIAGWCEKSDYYHIQSEYGYVELLDEEQKVITKTNTRGEIVCTGFWNYAMPFIRYQTGDYSAYASKKSCLCGRNYELLETIEGRWMQEMLVCKDGSKVSITALNMHSNLFDNVKHYQLFQHKVGEVIIKIVKTDKFSDNDEIAILKEFMKKMGESIDFKVTYVSEIEKTQRGKYKYLIQKLNI